MIFYERDTVIFTPKWNKMSMANFNPTYPTVFKNYTNSFCLQFGVTPFVKTYLDTSPFVTPTKCDTCAGWSPFHATLSLQRNISTFVDLKAVN